MKLQRSKKRLTPRRLESILSLFLDEAMDPVYKDLSYNLDGDMDGYRLKISEFDYKQLVHIMSPFGSLSCAIESMVDENTLIVLIF